MTSLQSASISLGKSCKSPNISKWNMLFDKSTSSWLSFTPFAGQIAYPCYTCRDIFRSKNSFIDHVNRRSILIKYKCPQCPRNGSLIYYNPCAFLLHCRQHFSLLSGYIYLSRLEISILPFGMGGFLPLPDVTILFDVEEDRIGDGTYINSRFYSPNFTDKGNSIVKMQPCELFFLYTPAPGASPVTLILKQISSNIPCCQFVTWNSNNRLSVQNVPNPPTQEVREPVTSESAPVSEGSTQDTVLKTTQEQIVSTDSNVQVQLKTTVACPECKVEQVPPLQGHFLGNNKPLDEFACSVCNYVAPTLCALEAHKRVHKHESPFVCPECGTEFGSWEDIEEHINNVCFHLAKRIRFKCPGKCTKLFSQNVPYSAHFTQHIYEVFICITCKEMVDAQDFFKHKVEKSVDCVLEKRYKCSVCVNESMHSLNKENYEKHIQFHTSDKTQCIYIFVCAWCRSYFRSAATYALHIKRCPKLLSLNSTNKSSNMMPDLKVTHVLNVCHKCNTKTKYNISDVRQSCPKCESTFKAPNQRQGENRGDNLFFGSNNSCLLCNENVSTTERSEHIINCKYGKLFVVMSQKDFQHTPTKIKTEIESPKSDDSAKKKRKRTSIPSRNKKLISEPILDLQPEVPMEFDGTYHCNLCDYVNADRKNFHEHIIGHRTVSTSYQCMECGECFVVKPSLIKHLQYYHQVTDTDQYFEENNCFDKGAVKELKEVMKLAPGEVKGPVAKNQCRVCLQQFGDELELGKHFRVHGMAFLLRNTK